MYEIQHKLSNGWQNIMIQDGRKIQFTSKELAQHELDEYLEDLSDMVAHGHAEVFNVNDFRVRKV